jgi:hypothetical protein
MPDRGLPTAARITLFSLASPLLTGVAFYAWLQWSPKSWIDPACGLQTWALIASTPVIGAGAVTPGFYAHGRQAGSLTIVATTVVTTVLTLGACLIAFLLWFGQHMCGE